MCKIGLSLQEWFVFRIIFRCLILSADGFKTIKWENDILPFLMYCLFYSKYFSLQFSVL